MSEVSSKNSVLNELTEEGSTSVADENNKSTLKSVEQVELRSISDAASKKPNINTSNNVLLRNAPSSSTRDKSKPYFEYRRISDYDGESASSAAILRRETLLSAFYRDAFGILCEIINQNDEEEGESSTDVERMKDLQNQEELQAAFLTPTSPMRFMDAELLSHAQDSNKFVRFEETVSLEERFNESNLPATFVEAKKYWSDK